MVRFMRTGQHAMTVIFGSNSYSASTQHDTGATWLNPRYLYSLCHTVTPSLFLSVWASYTRSNQNTSCDPSLKCCR